MQPADKKDLDKPARDHRHDDRCEDSKGKGEKVIERHGRHAAEHDKLALGEIDDAGCVVNDIEPYGNDRVDDSVGDAGNDILEKKIDVHAPLSCNREYLPIWRILPI